MGLQKNQKNAILSLLAIFSQISTEPLNSKSDAPAVPLGRLVELTSTIDLPNISRELAGVTECPSKNLQFWLFLAYFWPLKIRPKNRFFGYVKIKVG